MSDTKSARDRAIELFNSKKWCDADYDSVRGLEYHIPLLEKALIEAEIIGLERAATIAEPCASVAADWYYCHEHIYEEAERLKKEHNAPEKGTQSMSDINHPKHYNQGKIEVIEFIEDKNLGFHLGNAVKYIARAGIKDPAKEIEDLEKAIWYIKRQIEWRRSIEGGRAAVRPNDMNAITT